MNWRNRLLLTILVGFTLSISACSKEQGAKKVKETGLTTQKAAKAIEGYGRNPIDKARATQLLGEKRTKNIDQAINKMNGN